MKYLIVEDELISRRILEDLLLPFGECHFAVNGQEAIDSFCSAHELNDPYDVIFMDIMMPVVDGLEALLEIRSIEKSMKLPLDLAVKVLMTTALEDADTIIKAFIEGRANSFLVKPISRQRLLKEMITLKVLAAPMMSETALACLNSYGHRKRWRGGRI